MSCSFGQHEHLKTSAQFKDVFKKGKRHREPLLELIFCSNDVENSRLGFIVSKKVGNAVKRNHVRRIWKEAFRLEKTNFTKHRDMIVRPKAGYTPKSINEIRKTLIQVLGT